MEFIEKLRNLRKQKGITQEELAEKLFVSRTAVSKWESGKGYPSIDSLKMISKFYSVTVDELLSGDEMLALAEEENKTKENRFADVVFGILDCCAALLLFLP
ncbi:MAG: helix-turn-helix transcriptional regulator, partial [Oscillospiraceae bacterium]|nr:helix-turn-helix transcriptional regulator [Oscillospiraceae bacterium]